MKIGKLINRQLTKDDIKAVIPELILFLQFNLTALFLLTSIFSKTDLYIALVNLLVLSPLLGIEFLLPIPYAVSCTFNTLFFSGVYYLNQFLFTVRGRPLNYIDVFCISDGLKVANNFSPIMNTAIAYKFILALLLLIAALGALKINKSKRKYSVKIFLGIAITAYSVCILALNISFNNLTIEKLVWYEDEYIEHNGIPLAIFYEYLNSKIVPPEGYTSKKSEAILSNYTDNTTKTGDSPTNVIVIMNEALTDYSLIGETVFSEDPLPFIHSMNNNCIKGKLGVNAFAGSTCNTEFEFLTGDSLLFLPQNSIPYISYSLNNCDSFASDLLRNNYSATAIHPYFAQEWRRTQNYTSLGFEDFISGERFSTLYTKHENYNLFKDINNGVILDFGSDLEYIRGYISDKECFSKIEDLIKEKNNINQKSFIFAVTIQNHASYTTKDFKNEIEFTDDKHFTTEQYLNLIRITDNSFKDLISSLENYPEKTVVVMFGDHQPAIYSNFYEDKIRSSNEFEEKSHDYIVPYIMWANYDIDWKARDFISVNYLSAVIKQNLNLPLTPFDSFRLEAMEKYPVITSNYCVDSNGNYISPEECMNDNIIKQYHIIQYNRLFDK